MDYSYLLEYCDNESQTKKVQAMCSEGSFNKAAIKLGLAKSTVHESIQHLINKASKQGASPQHDMTHSVPDGFTVKGVSSYYNAKGELTGQWVKSHSDSERRTELLAERLESFEWTPAPEIKRYPREVNEELCTLLTLTDFHLGSYCYSVETDDDWDMNIAEDEYIKAINEMCEGSPNSKLGILNLQGDFLHWDGLDAVTPTAKHILDADTRFSKLIDVSLDIIMHSIELMLKKFDDVKVIVCEGNHDIVGSMWIRKAIKKIFANNPRVEIDDTDFPFYAHLHGEIMLGFHHGHKAKSNKLPEIFASEPRYRSMWGNSKYCYIHTGHYHHTEQQMSESGGAIVERHPTLTGRDSYAARLGLFGWRAAHAITYHKITGEHRRVTVTPKIKNNS